MTELTHITQCDDPKYLPFARARIKAMRATGLQSLSQRFEVEGVQIGVRIEGGYSFISIGGGDYVVAYSNNRWPTQDWDKVFVNDKETDRVYAARTLMYRSKCDVAALIQGGFWGWGFSCAVSPHKLIDLTCIPNGAGHRVFSRNKLLKMYVDVNYTDVFYKVHAIKCHGGSPNLVVVKITNMYKDENRTLEFSVLRFVGGELEEFKLPIIFPLFRVGSPGGPKTVKGVSYSHESRTASTTITAPRLAEECIAADFAGGYFCLVTLHSHSSASLNGYLTHGPDSFELHYINKHGVATRVEERHIGETLISVAPGQFADSFTSKASANRVIVSTDNKSVYVVSTRSEFTNDWRGVYMSCKRIQTIHTYKRDPDTKNWGFVSSHEFEATERTDPFEYVYPWHCPLGGASIEVKGYIWSEQGCFNVNTKRFMPFPEVFDYGTLSEDREPRELLMDRHDGVAYMAVSPRGLSATLFYTSLRWYVGIGDAQYLGIAMKYRIVLPEYPGGDEVLVRESVEGMDVAAMTPDFLYWPFGPTRYSYRPKYTDKSCPLPTTILRFPHSASRRS